MVVVAYPELPLRVEVDITGLPDVVSFSGIVFDVLDGLADFFGQRGISSFVSCHNNSTTSSSQ